jgi:hypothetical protein
MLQSGAVWWRGDLLQRRRSTPSSAYPVYRVERQDQQPHGTLGAGRGEQWGRSRVVVGVGVGVCSKNSCRRRIYYYSGPFKFLDCLLGFAFPSTRSDGPQSGDEVGFAVEAGPITGPACANGGCSAQTKPQAPSRGVTSGRRASPVPSQSSHKCSQSLGEAATPLPMLPILPILPTPPTLPTLPTLPSTPPGGSHTSH